MKFHLCTFIALSGLLLTAPAFSAQPNIIFFMADDMGMGDTSAYQDLTGNSDAVQVHTPNMERLANRGMRFSDAHTPSSRCTTTRYSLLTGRYVWRSRMKYWVLYGSQGDPLIERDRPTIATLLRDQGYRTGMFGKWHVGLRYRNSEGKPAAGWDDADLTQPLFDGPLDHGFDVAKYTSRSHGTSGPDAGSLHKNKAKRNSPKQNIGPGHLDGRTCLSATGNGKQLKTEGPDAYVLTQLGSRHSDNAIAFMEDTKKPFFLYYPSNSNHGPYTPDKAIGGKAVTGAARTVSGEPMNPRYDYIYENDVALGRLLDHLEANDDPRHPGKKLIETTIVIFTSDNGAEKADKVCTGPFRSNKGSVYEGGHRVPFIVAWPDGGVPAGETSQALIGLQDMYATFAEITGTDLPHLSAGEKGGEDSVSVLPAWRGQLQSDRPMFYNDHKDAVGDNAVCALRLDNPTVNGHTYEGKWKCFFSPDLLRAGNALPTELYELGSDQREEKNRLAEEALSGLVAYLTQVAEHHRNSGGHRMTELAASVPITVSFLRKETDSVPYKNKRLPFNLEAERHRKTLPQSVLNHNPRGLGISGKGVDQVNEGEALVLSFEHDVIIDSVGITAGNGRCGGYYSMGDRAPLAIYCVDADNDAKDQQGILSDLGVLKKGEILRLDSSPHYHVEAMGQWRLSSIRFRNL